jgi:hypothetical protein
MNRKSASRKAFPKFPLVRVWILLALFMPGITSGQTTSLYYPWAGGLNSCQFNAIDINLDGKTDLLVFDRHGNRILPLINNGTGLYPGYDYKPEYADYFPDLHDWVICTDYDCDGKQDIFTYGLGGIRVFHNISDTILKFKLVTNLLSSYYYTGKVGILVTPVDYPAIADIDGDRDPDILTFFGLGSYVEYHRNLSIEKYGTCDSLDFKLQEKCWGNFRESESSNRITLHAACPYKDAPFPCNQCDNPRHTGSTLKAIDLNNDNVADLILGDVDFPNIYGLYNGGTRDSADIASVDTVFPAGTSPVNLFSFPSISWLDADHDSVNDLIFSPFDPNLLISEDRRSVWLYHNAGSNSHPQFRFVTDNFIQNGMIDVGSNSYPVFEDIDADGLKDLITGSYGSRDTSYYQQGFLKSDFTARLWYYRNTGTSGHPAFQLITDDYAGLKSLRLTGFYPTFGDIDADGDDDLILGCTDGSLVYLENTAGSGKQPVYATPVAHWQSIDVGAYSTPCLFDLDNDGKADLIIGEQNGNINYYRNTGSATIPKFSLITDSLGKINTTNPLKSYYGYSTPFIFKDKKNHTDLVTGSEEGLLHFYPDITQNLTGRFPESDTLYRLVSGSPFIPGNIGWRTSLCLGHLTDATLFDLVAGNYSGGLNYFSSKPNPAVVSAIMEPSSPDNTGFTIFPNPADHFIKIRTENPGLSGTVPVFILSMSGILLKKTNLPSGSSEMSMNTSDLPNGIYIIRLGSQYRKIIVIHP